MKDYHEMAESVLERRDRYAARQRKQRRRLTASVSCICLCALLGAGVWRSSMVSVQPPEEDKQVTSAPSSRVEESDQDIEQEQPDRSHDEDETPILSVDGAPLVHAAADLTQDALYERMGGLLPSEPPKGFVFDSATFSEYGYSVYWSKGMEELHWRIRDYREGDAQYLTGVEQTENYDLSLYPIPRAQSVPEELWQIVNDPMFRGEELTQAAVNARAYRVHDAGDSDGHRMHFSVLYGDKVVTITSKGVSPEWMYRQLSGLSGTEDAPMQSEAGETGALDPFDAVWGGSYLDSNGHWVVWLTQDTPENRAQVFQRNPHISEQGTRFKTADYSLTYLTRLMADVSRGMVEKRFPFVIEAALREDLNRVEVWMTVEDAQLAAEVQALDTLGGAIEFRYGVSATIEDALEKGS